MSTDPASAARRAAEQVRMIGYDQCSIDTRLLQQLLPILDAIAASGEADDVKVGRWANVIGDASETAGQTGHLRSARLSDSACRDIARAAIALADAERVAETTSAFEREYIDVEARIQKRRAEMGDRRSIRSEPTKRFKL